MLHSTVRDKIATKAEEAQAEAEVERARLAEIETEADGIEYEVDEASVVWIFLGAVAGLSRVPSLTSWRPRRPPPRPGSGRWSARPSASSTPAGVAPSPGVEIGAVPVCENSHRDHSDELQSGVYTYPINLDS